MAFLSYSRGDDEQFRFVDPLINGLKAFVHIKSGRTIDIFVDRESIGWGEDWQQAISRSVDAATVFLPIVTANYLRRPHCREEFLDFIAKAQVMGVTELLLPIVPFSSAVISVDSQDEIAAHTAKTQYHLLESAILKGYHSPEWMTEMSGLADDLLTAVAQAEVRLASATKTDIEETALGLAGREVSAAEDGQAFVELTSALNQNIEAMAEHATRVGPHFEDLAEAANSLAAPSNPTPAQAQMWATNVARQLTGPSKSIEADGIAMYKAAMEATRNLEALRTLAQEYADTEFGPGISEGVGGLLDQLENLTEVESSMNELLTSMRQLEAFSMPVRKAVAPLRRGVTAVRDTIRLTAGWDSLR
ncbi:toll/interleukin-1 receptor domain-containing protein [Spongisporangium articulatum]|uniref:Toll/interleukin-1 receptor domain-containing protein n=1 Tax=Spongisporangium articulatum TaxID=3362603 RepID=A0ABW8ALB4_9ACTN